SFPRLETAEIHLATNFQSLVFDHPALPAELRKRMYDWLDINAESERKSGDTAEQFYYKARKKAIGPFKKDVWGLPAEARDRIAGDLERTFGFLFDQLKVAGTATLVTKYIKAPYQAHSTLERALVTAVDDAEAGE
ncbi:MAG: aldolase, partial [Gemmatimonadota bacterium]